MPLIQVRVIEGVFSETQKDEIVHKLTEAMVAIEGENMRAVTWVIIEEVKSGDWAIGGKVLTTADVKAIAAAKPSVERSRAEPAGPAGRLLRLMSGLDRKNA